MVWRLNASVKTSAQVEQSSAGDAPLSTWSPAATGGKRLRAAQTPDVTCHFPPASSAPSEAPALAPALKENTGKVEHCKLALFNSNLTLETYNKQVYTLQQFSLMTEPK